MPIIGDRTVRISAVLAVIIMSVTMWMEPAPVNQDGQARDVKTVCTYLSHCFNIQVSLFLDHL